MALSANFDLSTTRTLIIESSLRKLGALAEGQAATATSLTTASEALNYMIKAWAAEGMPVWNLKRGYIYPLADDSEMDLNPASTADHWTEELILTKLTDNAASGATTITVSTTAGIDVTGTTTNSDIIGVEMNDGSIHWTTISAGGGTTGLTLAAALLPANQTASSSNRVYAYTTRAQAPMEIEGAWRVNAATGDRIEVRNTALFEILDNVNLTSDLEGPVLEYNYQKQINTTGGSVGVFRIWPRFENGDEYLEILFQAPFDDMDAATNNPTFPQEWFEAIVYGLAVRLAPEYKLPLQERMIIKEEAQAMKDRANMSSRENASIVFQPEGQNG